MAVSIIVTPQVNAQGRGPTNQPQAFDQHDISGYWELGPDDRSVPPADLTQAATANMAAVQDADVVERIFKSVQVDLSDRGLGRTHLVQRNRDFFSQDNLRQSSPSG